MEFRFRIGDRVVAKTDHSSNNIHICAGDFGTVCDIRELCGAEQVGVEWDKRLPDGHSCGHKCKDKHGWRVWWDEINIVEDDTCDIAEHAFMEILKNVEHQYSAWRQ